MKNIHTKDQIREILFSCLQCFVIENQELIKSDVNERTLTAGFHYYLKQHQELRRWDIDCEYNRIGNNPKRGLNNELDIPDIIIHKRGSKGPNYIVIEGKKSPVNESERQQDLNKLLSMKQALGYTYGVFIEFSIDVNAENITIL